MIKITLINGFDGVEVDASNFFTSHSANKLFIDFNSDDKARDYEDILKMKGFKTSHSNNCITVFDLNDIDIVVK